jgi:nucleoredoxin
MPLFLIILFLFASASGMFGGVMPLTAKEIALMLRAGYSSEAVLRDLSTRRYADTFDSAIEKQLTQAGANAALIESLRSGTYQLSPSEIAAAKEKLAGRQAKPPEVSLPSKTIAPASQEKNTSPRAKAPETALPADVVYQHLKGDLVYYHYGTIVHFDDTALEHKKLYLFFFTSNGSRPGHKLTTQLVEYYNRVAPQHPEFEVIFISADRSQFGMETCITQSNMPWPALAYDKLDSKGGAIQKDLVREIPCLVLVDASGRVLSPSGKGEKDSSPEKVLADLDQIFARGINALARTP